MSPYGHQYFAQVFLSLNNKTVWLVADANISMITLSLVVSIYCYINMFNKSEEWNKKQQQQQHGNRIISSEDDLLHSCQGHPITSHKSS